MATYREIQEWVRENHGWLPKTCWIAHCKEQAGLDPRVAPNRQSESRRLHPCPPGKAPAIFSAFKHFEM